MSLLLKTVTIYTDGSCKGNPGPGGWGAVLLYTNATGVMHKKVISGVCNEQTTNNRMEMLAVIESLKMLKESCSVTVFTDSEYICKVTTRIKAKQKVKANADLANELATLLNKHACKFEWVKAHAGNEYNEIANELAQSNKVRRT